MNDWMLNMNGQASFYEWTDAIPMASTTTRRSEGRFIPVQTSLNKHAEGLGGGCKGGGGGWGVGIGEGVLLRRSTAVHSSASPLQ